MSIRVYCSVYQCRGRNMHNAHCWFNWFIYKFCACWLCMVPCNVVWIFHPGLVVPLMPPKNSIGETHGRPFSQQGQKMEEKPKKHSPGAKIHARQTKSMASKIAGKSWGHLLFVGTYDFLVFTSWWYQNFCRRKLKRALNY